MQIYTPSLLKGKGTSGDRACGACSAATAAPTVTAPDPEARATVGERRATGELARAHASRRRTGDPLTSGGAAPRRPCSQPFPCASAWRAGMASPHLRRPWPLLAVEIWRPPHHRVAFAGRGRRPPCSFPSPARRPGRRGRHPRRWWLPRHDVLLDLLTPCAGTIFLDLLAQAVVSPLPSFICGTQEEGSGVASASACACWRCGFLHD
jgi:hypothetical protein